MSKPTLYVQRLSEAAVLPKRGSALAAGWDLAAAKACVVPAKGRAIVATDLSIATPEDCYARIAPRSGLAVKKFIDVGAGVVDQDYRGPVGVVLFNYALDDAVRFYLTPLCAPKSLPAAISLTGAQERRAGC